MGPTLPSSMAIYYTRDLLMQWPLGEHVGLRHGWSAKEVDVPCEMGGLVYF